MKTREFTPEVITELRERQVFVFGSNLNGNHAGGAAKLAVEKFGAIDGQAVGLQGHSYAIPTLSGSMEKLSIKEIEHYVLEFFKFADKNPQLDFYVTKIGCGIANFSIKEMQSIFHKIDLTYVFNVALPQEFCVINGYKGYDEYMKCRNMKFEEGKEYHQDGDIKVCNNGIHFCENPLDVLRYYRPLDKCNYTSVSGIGEFSAEKTDSKIATSDIKIGAKVDFKSIVDFGIEFTFKKCNYLSALREKLNANKDYNTLAGQDYNTLAGQDSNTLAGQDFNTLAGQDSNTLAGQDYNTLAGQDSNTLAGQDFNTLAGRNYNTLAGRNYNTLAGQDSNTLAGRNYNTLAGQDYNTLAGQDYNTLAGQDYNIIASRYNNTIELSGTSNIAVAANGSKINGKKGNLIVLAEFDGGVIKSYQAAIIDGKKLKEDVFYCLKDGKFTEADNN